MQVFWRKGYSGASMQDVSSATNLKPGSIYLAFGNKEGLYRSALRVYADQSSNLIKSTIEASDSVGEGICTLLKQFVEQANPDCFYSCFLVRTRLELPQSNELHLYAGELLRSIEALYAKYLSQEFGEQVSSEYAAILMLHIFGIRVYGYEEFSKEKLLNSLVKSLPWLPW